MTISYEAIRTALSKGEMLKWDGFGEHKGGEIALSTGAQRRLFNHLLLQESAAVAQAHEDLFVGLVDAWNSEDPSEAPSLPASSQAKSDCGVWRLHQIETLGFGGLNAHDGPVFSMFVNGLNWCLEGQNGSGKTSLTSAIVWAMTGKSIREQDGPIEELGLRYPVRDEQANRKGDWPPLASFPTSPSSLAKTAEVWVRLTFKSGDNDIATAVRSLSSPPNGKPVFQSTVDARLLASPELVETGLLMPCRLSRIGFGEKSQSLYEAVKIVTGLDRFADLADGCVNLTHAGRSFLRFGKQNGIENLEATFAGQMLEARKKAELSAFAIPKGLTLASKDAVVTLDATAKMASDEATSHLDLLRAEVPPNCDIATLVGRRRIRDAVSSARAVVSLGTKGIGLFDAWRALTNAAETPGLEAIPGRIEEIEFKLEEALNWHARQVADERFRLKALAARLHVTSLDNLDDTRCPLCDSPLLSDTQKQLKAELLALRHAGIEAGRTLEDRCRGFKEELQELLPKDLHRHRDALRSSDPRQSYFEALCDRFCNEPPFGDLLLALGKRTGETLLKQRSSLPSFSTSVAAPVSDEAAVVIEVRQQAEEARRIVALVAWWRDHRQAFLASWQELIGQKPGEGDVPSGIERELARLEAALAKSEPLDEIAAHLRAAAQAATRWRPIREQQDVREAIAKAIEPLKGLRSLVGAETARSIAALSTRIRDLLARIHLRERLAYETTSLEKKTVRVGGWFEPGMQIDASLVANTSWLRAILWAFVLALREETVEKLGANPFPLLLLDDPQATFDPRNEREWADEIARLGESGAAHVFLTTHSRRFAQVLVDHSKFSGVKGLIGGVNKGNGVATIVNGGELERLWSEALEKNDDVLARAFIAAVRIYCEDLLKFMLRGQGQKVPDMTLGELEKQLRKLQASQVRPFNTDVFAKLIKTLSGGGGKPLNLINEVHHKADETFGLAEAKQVKEFWENTLRGEIQNAFAAFDSFESFHGEPRVFPWPDHPIPFPEGLKPTVRALTFLETGIAAAAKSDGLAGDGIVTVKEWDAGKSVVLPGHEVFQLAASTLDPVASVGDVLIVSPFAKVHPRNLVVASVGGSLLARRYNEVPGHPGIVVLTAQGADPQSLSAPVLMPIERAECRKIVGTIFASHRLSTPKLDHSREIVELEEAASLMALVKGCHLLRVSGSSAEPIALNGQFLITSGIERSPSQLNELDGRPIVAVDEDGVRYFKRLRCAASLAVLESLNPDRVHSVSVLSLDGNSPFPTITHAMEVIGVLFELPT